MSRVPSAGAEPTRTGATPLTGVSAASFRPVPGSRRVRCPEPVGDGGAHRRRSGENRRRIRRVLWLDSMAGELLTLVSECWTDRSR
jgi:hypothetical protein